MDTSILKKITLPLGASIEDAMRAIDAGSVWIALVVEENGRLAGTVTDGDIRRGILAGKTLASPVVDVMNHHPTVALPHHSRDERLNVMLSKRFKQLPLVDADGRVIGVQLLDDLVRPEARENWAVVMAGGLGERLRPYTQSVPKPLLLVGNQPILERVMRQLSVHGLHRVFVSVNFMAEKIEGYFQDGASLGLQLEYLKEKERLGTAGALKLLPQRPTKPFVVMNADLLTQVSFSSLLDFHEEEKAALTVCVSTYETTVPYGVVGMDGARVTSIVEKPRQTVFINAGIYVLEPRCLDLIPQAGAYDMPTLIQELLKRGETVASFPITESWLDIGHLHDYQRAIVEAMQHPSTKES